MKCFSIQVLRLLTILSICSYGLAAAAQTRIFNSSPSAQPGEAISLQGNFGAAAKAYVAAGAGAISLPVLVQSAGQATVQVPSTLALDMYQIWVEDQGQRSPSVYVNRARGMHFDSPEVGPGGPLRLFGRNLQLSGSAAQVRFQARNGSSSSGLAVVQASQSDAYTLRLTAPTSLTPGVVYDVYVSNGRGGSAGETLVERPITAIAAGGDYFQLGVGWAAKLTFTGNVYNVKTDARLPLKATGNGTTDDRPAIQAAIERAAAAGGGVVYLPAGTYKLIYSGWGGLVMRNRVVVQGAGKASTFIKFGYAAPAGYSGGGQAIHLDNGTYQSGFADLALLNIDTAGKWTINMFGKGTELFLQRVRFDLNVGEWLMLRDSNKLLVANSDITQGVNSTSGYRGPIMFVGCTNLVMSRNTITYAVNGLNLDDVQDVVFEENRIYRDGNARYPAGLVNHVLIMNFAQNVAVKGNLFKLINGPAQNINDGETIIAEGGAQNRVDEDAGTVSTATATTLQDNSKNWGAMRQQPVVAIVHGPGMGQWRAISRRSGNTLTLSQAWDVVPTAASRYAIFNWGSRSWLLQGNTLEGHQRGVTLYGNATLDVAIVGNTLTNSGSIDLTPWQANQAHLGVPQEFLPMYNNQIVGNTVANTNGANGVFIGVHTVQYLQARTFGTSVIGLEVRRNSLTAGKPNTPAQVDATYPEGYLNFLNFQQGSEAYVEEQEPAILGSIFQDNTAINCDQALHLNSGAYNTLVCNTTLTNVGRLVEDVRLGGLPHSSVGTATCLQTSTAGLRAPENPAGATAGLNYKYYEGYWDYLPDFAPLTPAKTGLATGLELSMRRRDYGYAVSYSGYVTVPADGQYSFILNSDDGSRLYIGSTLVVDNNQQGEHERTGSIGLQAGTHALTVTFLQRGGAQLLAVSYLGPGVPKQPIPAVALRHAPASSALQLPVADAKTNSPIARNARATRILRLTGSSPSSQVVGFTLHTLPSVLQGTLYINGRVAAANTAIPVNQADLLSFEPAPNYTGNTRFSYTAVDSKGIVSSAATFTVPVTVPLPVTLTQFAVRAQGLDALLSWNTASEQNSDYFAVERSFDATRFAEIGRVTSAGTKTTATEYGFTDAEVGSKAPGISYYRLRQVDIDGTVTYSPVRTVAMAKPAPLTVEMYPNPTDKELRVLLPAAGARFTVYSTAGARLLSAQTTTTEGVVDVQPLPTGTYLFVVQPSQGAEVQKLFVKR